MKVHGLGWIVFQWFLLTLTAYRLQRIVTTDDWPPSLWFRGQVYDRFGKDSSWNTFFRCPWCFGFWMTLAVFSVASYVLNLPLPLLQAFAATTVVGQVGMRDD